MRIMGIESSCDETSISIIEDGRKILSNVIFTQIDTHKVYGGVVPEIASREHIKAISYVAKQALEEAKLGFEDIDLIAVTKGPGLVGALLVGISYAKGLSLALDKPLIGVNHMQGHICANYLEFPDLEPPFISLVVSGGHTYLVDVLSYTDYKVIGKTRDDAAGESFDKVSRALGFGYPGGPAIQNASYKGNKDAIFFPRVMLEKDSYDFSFSGLKTSVLNYLNQEKMAGNDINPYDVAASFQKAVNDVLVEKSLRLLRETRRDKFVLSGGVAANKDLRENLKSQLSEMNVKLYYPSLKLCTDNAAMIASAGYYNYLKYGADNLRVNVIPNLGLEKENND
ncbi:tRNA (adenosine(37)-N6)-threonylcarbamoyltransferase complex transferase subunit TsaD [Helcococcus ovis]|uniref:tRNA N6-adenosine threonylcarbamoyltransferase n=1 Tax=Helcococcus ovis TaxID=72026 RepID=A0A4R9C285_9FIRM|nr:tRNA (adenosine(37)-N6)-threonylcarbamoyltransferase complex transferase subunit TsaD [Helcococcus ovis]TFF64194.1 tRNA (adenosine(37)-N6)-threonylcarbamoyltransferase complex transferase subunit TsaD [Helcococcus ovis]TFF65685.1 tRNA (adenosine(37)-N6)-threonylcarbamoyltransferase complex transferase subunit TsaD [Helcococcus ovis]TFF66691.1 tRNA (adenosine(37)-N6)-threonylcarbamoyltransferase complex transferase subunit TsaD [Helcococcus ovis]WNZ00755.1 tRNA (adenosine(37)-N6)-threonylcarb